MGEEVEFFHQIDVTDKSAVFIRRTAKAGLSLLQSHGWLPGRLQDATLDDVQNGMDDGRSFSVVPASELSFANRHAKPAKLDVRTLPRTHIRPVQGRPPKLSVVFMRWGGKVRVGDSSDAESLETDGGWGGYGCPPSDWYIAGVIDEGILCHPELGVESTTAGPRDVEVLSIFLGSTQDMQHLAQFAENLLQGLRGEKRCGMWMLWPAEWEADWVDEGFAGYVERKLLFDAMRSCESAELLPAFPHPSPVYEQITSKAWMANLCQEPKSRLPAAVLVDRVALRQNVTAAAKKALQELTAVRANTAFSSTGGTSVANGWQQSSSSTPAQQPEVKKGVVKLGFSWEAKHVWFWHTPAELKACLAQLVHFDGWMGRYCIVQEWVDFDFELRFFFLPPGDWDPTVKLEPRNFEYTAWSPGHHGPGAFSKLSHQDCIDRWDKDEEALNSAHEQAKETAQFLIAWLLEKDTCLNRPVAMIRLDFMLKRRGKGQAQVVFGEYCETGACCLHWKEGPPLVWKAVLDYALR